MVRILTWCLAIGGVLLYGYWTEVGRDESGDVSVAGKSNVFELKVGDCIAEVAEGEFSSTPLVPCSEPHMYEYFAEERLEGVSFPEPEELSDEALRKCVSKFEDYFGIAYADSKLEISWFKPTRESWDKVNDRTLNCLGVRMDNQPMVGRIRNY